MNEPTPTTKPKPVPTWFWIGLLIVLVVGVSAYGYSVYDGRQQQGCYFTDEAADTYNGEVCD